MILPPPRRRLKSQPIPVIAPLLVGELLPALPLCLQFSLVPKLSVRQLLTHVRLSLGRIHASIRMREAGDE